MVVLSTIVVHPAVNLTLTKTANVTTDVVIGSSIKFTITVSNYGSDNATCVKINEKLSPNFIHRESTASKGSYNKNTGVWTVGNLEYGETQTLVITFKVNNTVFLSNEVMLHQINQISIIILWIVKLFQ